jgi:hypothetical protein
MPQIDAPTVAEQRAQQREALLDAAEAILLGDAPLGPAVRAHINALAYRPAALLEPELGAEDPQLVAQLVQGVVNAGVRLLHGAGTRDEVEPLTVTLAQTLVRSRAR